MPKALWGSALRAGTWQRLAQKSLAILKELYSFGLIQRTGKNQPADHARKSSGGLLSSGFGRQLRRGQIVQFLEPAPNFRGQCSPDFLTASQQLRPERRDRACAFGVGQVERTQIGHRDLEKVTRGRVVLWRRIKHAVDLFRGIPYCLGKEVLFGVKMSVKPAVGKAGVTHDLGYTDLSNTMSPEFLRGSLDDTDAGVAFMFFRPWHDKGYSGQKFVR